MIFIAINDAFPLQLSDLGRKSASLDLKVICKLLAVKRYIK